MDCQTTLIINRVLPILFLLLLGYLFRRSGFLTPTLVEGLRQLVVNLALPAVLFLSFLAIDLQPAFVLLSAVIFAICAALFALGRLLQPRFAPGHPYFPFLMTGFEYGMLGVSLFGSAYGLANIGFIAVIDLGHEIFIWFAYLPLLLIQRDGRQNPIDLLRSFVTSPVVIAIVAGIILNLLGLATHLTAWPVSGALISVLELLANLTIPLILLLVGFGIQLDRDGLSEAGRVVALRLAVLLPLVWLLDTLLLSGILDLSRPYQIALFTLFILPPPFIIPLFMNQDDTAELRYVNNALTLNTVITIPLFALLLILNPTL